MKEAQSGDDLRGVEARPPLLEAAALLDVEHEVAAVQVLHHEEQVRLRRANIRFKDMALDKLLNATQYIRFPSNKFFFKISLLNYFFLN